MGDCACHASDLHLRWTGEGLAFAFLELTPACNNRCVGCSNVFAGHEVVSPPLSGRDWIGVIDRIAPYARWLKLTGGEPTLHPDFAEITTHLDQEQIPFRLLTNGRWPSTSTLLKLLSENSALESLLISLHGPDLETHAAFSGLERSFDEAVQTIRSAATAGLSVSTSTVINRHNWEQVPEIIDLSESLGASCSVFNRYIGTPLPELETTYEDNLCAFEKITDLASSHASIRLGTPLPFCLFPFSSTPCLAGRAFVTIDPWGNVRPCNHAPIVVGNIFEQDLGAMLESSLMSDWLRTPDLCANCDLVGVCRGGCRAEQLLNSTVAQIMHHVSSFSEQNVSCQDVF